MLNKEAIQRCVDYLLEKADKETIARALANSWLDIYRLYCIEDLDEEQQRCLFWRMEKNIEVFTSIVEGDDDKGFVLKNVKGTEEA